MLSRMCVAMNAKTFKEAQTTVSLVMILPLLPGFVVSFVELKTAQWMYLLPMLSNQTLIKELAKSGDIGFGAHRVHGHAVTLSSRE